MRISETTTYIWRLIRVLSEALSIAERIIKGQGFIMIVNEAMKIAEGIVRSLVNIIQGIVRATFSMKKATVAFAIRSPGLAFQLFKPAINFLLRR